MILSYPVTLITNEGISYIPLFATIFGSTIAGFAVLGPVSIAMKTIIFCESNDHHLRLPGR